MDEGKQQLGRSTLMVRSQFKSGADEGPIDEKDELIAVHKFLVPPAEVGVSLGLTINLGNYESARIDVEVKVPCYCEEVEEAYIYARRFCEDRIQAEVQSVRGSKGSKKIF